MGDDNLKVVWAEFSTLSWAVFAMSLIAKYRLTGPHLKLKTWPRLRPINLSLSMQK